MLLITGGTGLVGGMLISSLPGRIVALSRRPPHEPHSAVSWLRGDLAQGNFGLAAEQWRELRRSVTDIIHCAAEVRFSVPLEEARSVNTDGTARLLQFARSCPRLRSFSHVSTVYVFGAEEGILPEARARASRWISSYEQSKYEAETLALDAAASGLPVSVYRLSSIIGDASTGRVHQFNHVHQMLRLMPRHLLPAIPGDPDARMDLIPSDATCAALSYLVSRPAEAGAVFNICAGSERSWTLREIIDEAVAAYHVHGDRIRGPRLIAPHEFSRMLARFTGLTQDVANVASHFLPHLGLRQTFACERTFEALAQAGLEMPHIETYFGRVMRYCFESQWGNRAVGEYAAPISARTAALPAG